MALSQEQYQALCREYDYMAKEAEEWRMNTDRKQLAKQQARELLHEHIRERAKAAAKRRARKQRREALRDLAKREASR